MENTLDCFVNFPFIFYDIATTRFVTHPTLLFYQFPKAVDCQAKEMNHKRFESISDPIGRVSIGICQKLPEFCDIFSVIRTFKADPGNIFINFGAGLGKVFAFGDYG
jgi:hypothetical protein